MTLLVSDLHFGKNADISVSAFREAAKAEAGGPDRLVVIPGDLTQRAKKAELAGARGLIEELLGLGLRVVLTPGNHDFGSYAGERGGFGYGKLKERFRPILDLVAAQDEVVAREDLDTITVIGDDVFVALRSTHRGTKATAGVLGPGRIRKKQLRWAAGELERLRNRSPELRFHFVTHRSLWSDDRKDGHLSMSRRKRLEEKLLVPFGFRTYVHGHNHRGVSEVRDTPKLGHRMLRISVPTLSERVKITSRVEQHRGWMAWRLGSGGVATLVGS